MQRTLIIIKPDAVCGQHAGEIIDAFEKAGLRLRAAKFIRLTEAQARDFYKEHTGKPFFEPLIVFMTSAPILPMVWEGTNAIPKARTLMGATNSPEAAPGTIRRRFGTTNRYNATHGSDSPASAEREISFFFQSSELHAYSSEDWQRTNPAA